LFFFFGQARNKNKIKERVASHLAFLRQTTLRCSI
jgi:hypothetical protein